MQAHPALTQIERLNQIARHQRAIPGLRNNTALCEFLVLLYVMTQCIYTALAARLTGIPAEPCTDPLRAMLQDPGLAPLLNAAPRIKQALEAALREREAKAAAEQVASASFPASQALPISIAAPIHPAARRHPTVSGPGARIPHPPRNRAHQVPRFATLFSLRFRNSRQPLRLARVAKGPPSKGLPSPAPKHPSDATPPAARLPRAPAPWSGSPDHRRTVGRALGLADLGGHRPSLGTPTAAGQTGAGTPV